MRLQRLHTDLFQSIIHQIYKSVVLFYFQEGMLISLCICEIQLETGCPARMCQGYSNSCERNGTATILLFYKIRSQVAGRELH